ncbi:rhomboid family intramembrane serine protease [Candidatus Woesearchaeota archaeon]|nr:rhomboid family intramembrane serine protease [Candidatus Woesearchaeota archaeon]
MMISTAAIEKQSKSQQSESGFLLTQLWHVLATPFRLVLFVLGKRTFAEVATPVTNSVRFFFAPRFSILMSAVLIIVFIASLFIDIVPYLAYPADLFSLRFFTIITAGFLHADPAHLFGNVLVLYIFGRVVERRIGATNTALVYFGALIIAGLFSALINMAIGDNTPGLGASGAIMGIVATAMLLDPFYITYQLGIPLPVMIIGWIAIGADVAGILNPTEDGIGHFAHLGGFLSIAILAFFLSGENRLRLLKGLVVNIISLLIAGILLVFVL